MFYGGNGTQELGYNWDNNNSTTYGFNSALLIPTNQWSMVALVITPATNTLYVGTLATNLGTNLIVRSLSQSNLNVNEPWGGGMAIGGDPGNNPTNVSFGGYISSAAMFSNSLTLAQIETLFNAGESNGAVGLPFIISNPTVTNLELLAGTTSSSGGALTITASGYGTQPCGGYWQVNTGSGWVVATNHYGFSGGTNAPLVNTLQVGTLTFTNFQASNAGSYQLVITNAAGTAMSTVVSISAYAPPAGGYAAIASTSGYGAVALWPLNETVDPSTGLAVAYDVIGGFNGIYATNADNGGGNALNAFSPVAGPAAAGLTGFPAGGALGPSRTCQTPT